VKINLLWGEFALGRICSRENLLWGGDVALGSEFALGWKFSLES